MSDRSPAAGSNPDDASIIATDTAIDSASKTSGSTDVLARLAATLDARRNADANASYVASLFKRGEDTMLQKIGEEAVELILAAKGEGDERLVSEAADVWFHMLVLLSFRGLGPDDILNELERRSGVSGHAEKAARDVTPGDKTS